MSFLEKPQTKFKQYLLKFYNKHFFLSKHHFSKTLIRISLKIMFSAPWGIFCYTYCYYNLFKNA